MVPSMNGNIEVHLQRLEGSGGHTLRAVAPPGVTSFKYTAQGGAKDGTKDTSSPVNPHKKFLVLVYLIYLLYLIG
jgi:hypothetical protein